MSQPHPEIQKFVQTFENAMHEDGLTDLHSGGVAAARTFNDSRKMPDDMLPPIYHVADSAISSKTGEIPIRIYRPNEDQELPLLMWFHGGGWVLGDLDTGEFKCRKLAHDVGCVVVSVDYRRAPETPFPGAIDDCFAATLWAASSADELGVDPSHIAVAGDSAGGNLAACVALRARDAGLNLVFQLLVYPVIEANFDRTSYSNNAEGYLLTASAMKWFWDCYVPNIADRNHPDVAPIHASDLSGLPPALVMTAEFDPLRDEAEDYGQALKAAGVDTVTRRYIGMTHAFYMLPTETPVAEIDAATNESIEALRWAFDNCEHQ
ncbi:MAG: alpha/beta hydrolase [Gemmatimonadota bacterium]|nr:alpha/beta hydrolase [Gemmatimonadota bacterium]